LCTQLHTCDSQVGKPKAATVRGLNVTTQLFYIRTTLTLCDMERSSVSSSNFPRKERLWPVTCDMSSYLKLLTASTNCCTLPREINVSTVTLVNRDFYRMRENVCFWCIFGSCFQICFQNFSITHNFRSRLKGWNILRQDNKDCFYRGRHEVFKDFFSQKMVSCF